jgi:hypothetical protein
MLLVQALVAANRAWVERAGARVNAATLAMDTGTYAPEHVVRDVFRSVVTDPFQWYLDFNRQTNVNRILIDAKVVNSPVSDYLPARNPEKVTITPLVRMGGSDTMVPETDVFVDPPSTPAPPKIPDGMVLVRLKNVGGFAPGYYVGFLIDDGIPITQVIVQR